MGRRTLITLACLSAFLLVAAVAGAASGLRLVTVTSNSMAPTHPTGSRLLARPSDDVEVGDVVVIRTPQSWRDGYRRWRPALAGTTDDALATMVKRVVGVGGDVVTCCDAGGELLRNGIRLDEPWLAEHVQSAPISTFTVTVPPGHLWLMGDNRTHSFDSRAAHARDRSGFVPLDAVEAVVID